MFKIEPKCSSANATLFCVFKICIHACNTIHYLFHLHTTISSQHSFMLLYTHQVMQSNIAATTFLRSSNPHLSSLPGAPSTTQQPGYFIVDIFFIFPDICNGIFSQLRLPSFYATLFLWLLLLFLFLLLFFVVFCKSKLI